MSQVLFLIEGIELILVTETLVSSHSYLLLDCQTRGVKCDIEALNCLILLHLRT